MKKFTLIVFIFCSNIILAQTFVVGGQVFSSTQFFNHHTDDALLANGFKTYLSNNLGLGINLKSQRTKGFNMEFSLSYLRNDIRLVYDNTFSRNDFFYIDHEIRSFDIGILGRYALQYKAFQFHPILGFTISMGKANGTAAGFRGSNAQGSSGFSAFDASEINENFIAPMITFGSAFTILNTKKHLVEVFIKCNIAPRNIFQEAVPYYVNAGNILLEDELNGKFRAIQIGLSYYFGAI